MGLDDMLKNELRKHINDIKPKLVAEFKELTDQDVDEAGDDPDQIVDKIQQKTGQPREQVEQRVKPVASRPAAQ